MAIGLVCCLEKSRAKAQNYSVEAPLKSAGNLLLLLIYYY